MHICNPSPRNNECVLNVTAMLFYSAHKNTVLQKLNSCQIYYSTVHNTETVMTTLHATELRYSDNVKNARNNTPTPAIYLYDLVSKHWNSFGCYVLEGLFICHMKINTQLNNNWMQSVVE